MDTLLERQGSLKKIIVCGKGGVGKSTIVTLIADALREEGYSPLVMDTDESNPGLYRMFGFDKEPRPLLKLLSRFSWDEPEPDTGWITQNEIPIQDIPSKYILAKDSLKFMMVGKIENPFEGCACTMADITKDLVGKLILEDKQIVLIDAEAGVESFGRGLGKNVDTVLMIIEPSFESLAVGEKINGMANVIGIRTVGAILNKVVPGEMEEKMIDALAQRNIKHVGTVHVDTEISWAGLKGRAPGESKARDEVRKIARHLLGEANMVR